MKEIAEKTLVCLLIVMTLMNFIMTNNAYAEDDALGVIVELLEDVLGTVVGILTIIPKLIIFIVGFAANELVACVAYIDNGTLPLGLNPFDVIFGKIKLVDINFFNVDDAGGSSDIVKNIRTSVAQWYYSLRAIAVSILLVILVYVGIRMAIASVAQDKAMYKKMLVDWVASLCIVLLLGYIIEFILMINDALVKGIKTIAENTEIGRGTKLDNVYTRLGIMALGIDIEGFTAAIIYLLLVYQSASLFFLYFKRMLKVGFLIIIAPLITLTYSIDKMGDGKAQVLNAWMKEFIYTVIIQPVHCIIYVTIVSTGLNLLTKNSTTLIFDDNNNSLGYSIIAIMCVQFVKDGEKIFNKIFNIQAGDKMDIGASMATTAVIMSKAPAAGKALAQAPGKISAASSHLKAGGEQFQKATDNMRAGMQASKELKKGGSSKFDPKAYEDMKAQKLDEIHTAREAKQDDKLASAISKQMGSSEKYTAKSKADLKDDERVKDLMSKGYSKKGAMNAVRSSMAKEYINKANQQRMNQGKDPINFNNIGVRGTVNKAKDSFHDKTSKVIEKISKTRAGQVMVSAGQVASSAAKAVKPVAKVGTAIGVGALAAVGLSGGTIDFKSLYTAFQFSNAFTKSREEIKSQKEAKKEAKKEANKPDRDASIRMTSTLSNLGADNNEEAQREIESCLADQSLDREQNAKEVQRILRDTLANLKQLSASSQMSDESKAAIASHLDEKHLSSLMSKKTESLAAKGKLDSSSIKEALVDSIASSTDLDAAGIDETAFKSDLGHLVVGAKTGDTEEDALAYAALDKNLGQLQDRQNRAEVRETVITTAQKYSAAGESEQQAMQDAVEKNVARMKLYDRFEGKELTTKKVRSKEYDGELAYKARRKFDSLIASQGKPDAVDLTAFARDAKKEMEAVEKRVKEAGDSAERQLKMTEQEARRLEQAIVNAQAAIDTVSVDESVMSQSDRAKLQQQVLVVNAALKKVEISQADTDQAAKG